MPPKKRAQWTEQNLRNALKAIKNGMSIKSASKQYELPRTTLGLHFRQNNHKKKLGRTPVLTIEQEKDLVQRIHRLAEVGVPITSKILMRSVYSYVITQNIPNPFSEKTKRAGRKWLKSFFSRHPDVAKRRAQQMNPARAQKMNKFIVDDYFQKLKESMTKLELFDKPGNIYNMDEKGCRLTIHKQQIVLAKKGAKRVHLTAPEHGENVTIVGCGNALGQAVPPFVLFKGQRLKPEWGDHLPPGSRAIVTKKGSMTTEAFVSWLQHFSLFKNSGPTLLIFDGARSHLDITIVEAAENLGITLFCLPSNTTHELQPMDKSVFKSFETFWDEGVLNFLTVNPGKPITKLRFSEIFTKVWLKAMTPSNIISGFKATGIYPYCPDVIPESAFAPSHITHKEHILLENDYLPVCNESKSKEKENESANIKQPSTSKQPDKSGANKQPRKTDIRNTKRKRDISSDSDSTSDNSPDEISTDDEVLPLSELKRSIAENVQNAIPETTNANLSFKDIGVLVTPEIKVSVTKRKPAINCKAQEVTRNLFSSKNEKKEKNSHKPSLKKGKKITESWYCILCEEDRKEDMRLCIICTKYVHEACAGLTKKDKEPWICPLCT